MTGPSKREQRRRWRQGTGERFGLTTDDCVACPSSRVFPIYRWGWAPAGLATFTQLADDRLRPTKEPVARLEWRGGDRWAHLYDTNHVRPIKPMTDQQRAALEAAMLARRTCTECGHVEEWCLPTSLGRVCDTCCTPSGDYTPRPVDICWETTPW